MEEKEVISKDLRLYERIVRLFDMKDLEREIETYSLIERRAILGNKTEAHQKLIILKREKRRKEEIARSINNIKK